ncbi:kinesin light chain 1 [Pyrenochaeta sp. DS3sAY3a]|nr:kinesin light chain 1 [Pyrenochaeta sp. DS3sAY3a]
MRLLKSLPGDGGFELSSFDDEHPPPYAILSHTWTTGQEVTYDDLLAGTGRDKTGYHKIRFCSERAAVDGLEYFWIDACCINRSISDELSSAINSMFRWYQRAVKCYVYLTDVSVLEEVTDAEAFRISWEQAFRCSRWFTRGWTLQELLAPASVEFFSQNGKRLGSRISLEQEIHDVTGIPVRALRAQRLKEFSVEERLSWAAERMTTRTEDKVYCLLGIFEVFMSLIYGEGEKNAMRRLTRKIRKRHETQTNIGIQDLPTYLSLPFPRDTHFVGRESQLRSIERITLTRDVHQRMAIYGLGGSGKSALALEVAYRALADHTRDLVFWVPAMSRESFELAYREIGIRLQIPEVSNIDANVNQLVKEKLSTEFPGNWLMIIDNADDSSVLLSPINGTPHVRLIDYLPLSNKGVILFTTRSRNSAEDLAPRSVLELEDLSKEEALQLLVSCVETQALLCDERSVNGLLKLLEYLPLAIVQASAFIRKNNISASEYVSLMERADEEMKLFSEHFEDRSRYHELDNTIAKTWHVSFDQICKQDPLAAEYLSFMACIDHVKIPQSLLPSEGSLVQRAKAIGTLTGYKFMTKRQQRTQERVQGKEMENFFDMHRLVHLASVWWLNKRREHITWAGKAVARLEKLVPYGGHEARGVWTSYLSHAWHAAGLEGVPKAAKFSLLDRIGQCRVSLGHYGVAEVAHRQAELVGAEIFGPEHACTLMSMNHLAEVLEKQGKYKEAEIKNREILAKRKIVLGLKHPDTLTSMSNLALVLNEQGKYKEAEEMNRETLISKKRVLGLDHPDTLKSMSNLARLLDRRGKYEEAEGLNRDTLARSERVLGSNHPETLISISNLAGVLSRQGKDEEAEKINRETLAQRKKLLGSEHPNTLTSMNNLALVLDRQSKYKEAEDIYRQTLALKEKVLGFEHPDTLSGLSNLARVLGHQEEYEEAETLSRKTLAQKTRKLGSRHPSTLMSMYNLSLVLSSQAKYKEAEDISMEALAWRKEELGSNHPDTLRSMSGLAEVMMEQGRIEEAALMSRQALTQMESVLGPTHPDTVASASLLARLSAGTSHLHSGVRTHM